MTATDGPAATKRAPQALRAASLVHGSTGTVPAIIALVAFWIAVTMPWWREGFIIPWDARNHFYPMLRWLANELAAGRMPDFMAEIFAGRPSLPDPQSMATSPGFLALAAVNPAPSATAMDMLILAELLAGGIALILLGRLFGFHPLACLFAALVFVFGGAPMARLQHVLLVQSYAFVPVVLLALAFAVRRPTLWRGLIAGLALGLLAVGRDHVALLSLYAVAGFGVFLIARQPRPLGFLRRAWPGLLAGAFAALVIALPPVLATMATAAESNRPSFPPSISGSGGMCPACLLTLGFANIYDGLSPGWNYWGPGDHSFLWPNATDMATVQYYAGVAPLVLAGLVLSSRRGWTGFQWFAFAVTVGTLIYGMGNWTPLFAAIHAYLPGADFFRRASDASYVFNLGLALLVLVAAGRYASADDGRVSRSRIAVLVATAVFSAAAAAAVAVLHERFPVALDDIIVGLALALLALGALVWGAAGGPGRRLAVLGAVLVLTATDLALFSVGTRLNAQPPDRSLIQVDPMDFEEARALKEAVASAESRYGPVRVEMRGLGGAEQNLSLVLGVENISGYNPLRPASFDRATGSGPNSHLPKRRFGEQMTSYRSPLADLLGVRFLLLGAPVEEIDPTSAGAFGEPRRVGDAFLYENTRAVPRAVLVRHDRTRPLSRALAEGAGPLPELDWRTEALVADLEAPAQAGPQDKPAGSLLIVDHGPGRLEVEIDPAAEGFVILHELRTAGWTARVDGERRPLVPANGLFQAVSVAPGDRSVVFEYSYYDAIRSLVH